MHTAEEKVGLHVLIGLLADKLATDVPLDHESRVMYFIRLF